MAVGSNNPTEKRLPSLRVVLTLPMCLDRGHSFLPEILTDLFGLANRVLEERLVGGYDTIGSHPINGLDMRIAG